MEVIQFVLRRPIHYKANRVEGVGRSSRVTEL